MAANRPKAPRERQQTDESLVVERRKSDEEIGRGGKREDEKSDAVVRKARGRADEVLRAARDRADQALDRDGTTAAQRHAIRDQRTVEDSRVEHERTAADRALDAERVARMHALKSLLRVERGLTDESLFIERARIDEAVAARDNFMAMVSHDVRNMLGGVALTAQLQIAANPGHDQLSRRNRKSAEKIQRFTATIKRLVDDLIDVASIESGRFQVTPDSTDVGGLVEDALAVFHTAAAGKNLSLTGEVAPDCEPAAFDHERILQVLTNLLSNAIKFTDSGGSVTLRVRPVREGIEFAVSDTGRGIAPEHLDAVFRRFWQVRPGEKRGLGLGLFISKCIVEAHGGRIWAESVPGTGSQMRFTLPVRDP